MTNDVKKVPELRFPEFNEDWNERTLSDSIKILKSGLSRELSTTDIGLPVIRANNLQNYNLVLDDIKYWFKEDPKGAKTENYYLEKNDILVNFINSEAKMGTSCIIKSDFKRYTIYTTNILRYVTKEAYDSYFHYIYTQTYNYKKWIKIITKPAVNQASFTTVDFKKIPYYIPEFKEQQKIGEFFSKLDRQIELEEQKLAKLEEQKKGYMQKIFSQQLGIKDENGNEYPTWQSYKLGNLYKKGKAGGTPKSTESKYYNGEVPFLSISDITEQGKFIMNTEKSITQEGVDNSTAWLVPVNSINYAMYASVGYLSINKIEVATSQAIFNMVFEDNNLVEYIYYYLNHIRDKGILEKLVGTGTQSNLSASIMKRMYIKLPDYEEMVKITDFLSKVDKLIEKQNQKIDGLKERKKGFLQKMFV